MRFLFSSLVCLSMRYFTSFAFASLLLIISVCCAHAAEPVTGLWTTIDDETNTPKSVIYVYEYNNQIYGRVVKLFTNEEKRMSNIEGNPLILGSDIIWGMTDSGKRFTGGKILDPKKEKIYNLEMWIDKENLIVRGKIGPFGRNQTWVKKTDASLLPDKPLVPVVPKLK